MEDKLIEIIKQSNKPLKLKYLVSCGIDLTNKKTITKNSLHCLKNLL